MSDPHDLSDAAIRDIFISHGFTIKDGQTDLKPYVYAAAHALIKATKRTTMSLRDYVVGTKIITLQGKQKMSVRSLGFDDIQHLLLNKQGLIDRALKLFGEANFNPDNADPQQVREFGASLLAALPDLAAELIAIAADEPDLGPKAKRLPAPAQLEALMGIYELTFTEPDSVKNFFDRLASLMTSIPRPSKAVVPPKGGLNVSGATLNS